MAGRRSDVSGLTKAEKTFISLAVQGMSLAEISKSLNIKYTTAQERSRMIVEKLEAKSFSDALEIWSNKEAA